MILLDNKKYYMSMLMLVFSCSAALHSAEPAASNESLDDLTKRMAEVSLPAEQSSSDSSLRTDTMTMHDLIRNESVVALGLFNITSTPTKQQWNELYDYFVNRAKKLSAEGLMSRPGLSIGGVMKAMNNSEMSYLYHYVLNFLA